MERTDRRSEAERPRRDRLRLAAADALHRLLQATGRRIGLVLVYHRVGDRAGDPELDLDPALATALFERQLEHLARRYRLVPAAEVPARARQRSRGDRFPVAITFDDDLVSHATVVAPILTRRGIGATFFLGGGGRRGWWHDLQDAVASRTLAPSDLPGVETALVSAALAGRPGAIRRLAARIEALPPALRDDAHASLAAHTRPGSEPALDADGVRTVVASGGTIGFHTLGHYDLRTLDDEALARELKAGRNELGRVAGSPVDLLAYPHGKSDERVAAAAGAAGFCLAFTTEGTPVAPDTNPLRVPRIVPDFRSLGRFALQLARALGQRGAS